MPPAKSIKQRIKSARNISQITKAMEVVSATKMRKAQEFALRARPYAAASLEMLENLLARTPAQALPELLRKREVKNSAVLLVTSDKGLAGAFNANVVRKAEGYLAAGARKDFTRPGRQILITVGKKARDYFTRRGYEIQESFTGFGDYSTPDETAPVAKTIMDGFLYGIWDEVEAVYTSFRTTLRQEAVLKKILPVTKEEIEEMVAGILPERGRYAPATSRSGLGDQGETPLYHYEYKFEPSATEILEMLVPQLIRMHIHHIILESNASEHSARMVAMKNASDNARDLISDLTLEYNKSRQAGITRELTEITTGKEVLEH